MAETANIATMAEKVSADIFSVFGWESRLLANHNWNCIEPEKHHKKRGVKTHPTDAVFSYLDPYLGQQIYVNTDLKSYSSGSLESIDLTRSLRSLARATECANKSDEWQQLYVDTAFNHSVIGLLFVYNHDGEYDKDFEVELEKLAPSSISLDPAYYIGVISPRRVLYLNSVANDIHVMQGKQQVPASDKRFYFYPHLHRHKAVRAECAAATLWSLLSPLLLLGYQTPDGALSYLAYYDGDGSTVEEFEYLLDYLFRYQLATKRTTIRVNVWEGAQMSATNFSKAKETYARECWRGKADTRELFDEVLSNIEYRELTQVVRRFSQVQLGMGDANADI